MRLLMWQYTKDLNDVNNAIKKHKFNFRNGIVEDYDDWEGLDSVKQIVSIMFDANHMCYVVIWGVVE